MDQPNLPAPQPAPSAPQSPRRGPRFAVIVGLALALAAAIGVGALIGSTISAAQAARPQTTFARNNAQGYPAANGPGQRHAPGQCDADTVTAVNGATITATAADGSVVTIHTTASTTYTQRGQPGAASALTVGSRIHVTGTKNSDGSITATQIDIG